VPRNTPQEDRWVDNELADINAMVIPPLSTTNRAEVDERMARKDARLKRLFGSVENARQVLRYALGLCVRHTNKLLELKNGLPAAEILQWAQLSRYFVAGDGLWDLAEMIGLVSPKYCRHVSLGKIYNIDINTVSTGHDENCICDWQYVGNVITAGAVIPLLKDSARR
jgi:hypothetical protein